jgi:uncharacterized membrane protein YhaH (DUF805 family)
MSSNPYSSPQVSLTGELPAAEVKVFSFSGRLNRLRFWAYIFVASYLMLPLAGVGVAALMSGNTTVAFGLLGLFIVLPIVFGGIFTVRRLHDMDKSGWLWLLNFVPLANLYLLAILIFKEGTAGQNRFGAPPVPSPKWHWAAVLAMPALVLVAALLSVVSGSALDRFNAKAAGGASAAYELPEEPAATDAPAASESAAQ